MGKRTGRPRKGIPMDNFIYNINSNIFSVEGFSTRAHVESGTLYNCSYGLSSMPVDTAQILVNMLIENIEYLTDYVAKLKLKINENENHG